MSQDTTRGYTSWADALVDALDQAGAAPASHDLVDVSFGVFSERAGGGFYVALRFSYTVGNTADATRQTQPGWQQRRARQIVEAWEKASRPSTDPDAEER